MTEVKIKSTVLNGGMMCKIENQDISFVCSERSPKTISIFFKDGVLQDENIEIVVNKEQIEKVLLFLKSL